MCDDLTRCPDVTVTFEGVLRSVIPPLRWHRGCILGCITGEKNRSHEGCGRSDIESGGCEAKAAADAKASLSLATERKLTAAVGSKAAKELKAAADAAAADAGRSETHLSTQTRKEIQTFCPKTVYVALEAFIIATCLIGGRFGRQRRHFYQYITTASLLF